MTIETDDMDLAGDIIQSLANYLDIMVCTYIMQIVRGGKLSRLHALLVIQENFCDCVACPRNTLL